MVDEQLADQDRESLGMRLGTDVFERRLAREQRLLFIKNREGRNWLSGVGGRNAIMAACLRAAGLGALTYQNFLDIRLVENHVFLPGLPEAFEGFRLLQLSDLHCDLDPALMGVVETAITGISCDAVVLTGDYHDRIGKSGKTSLSLMKRLIPLLPTPRFGIFGNHDFLWTLPHYEEAGLRILMNEKTVFERGHDRIFLCGIDDPRFFRTHDLVRARQGIPPGSTTILLSHSPHVATQAATLGYSMMLSGHTHGGQICLPGGFAILRNAPVRAGLLAGAWIEGGMTGYTSRGTGACGVPARLFCPPEITLHILQRGGGSPKS